jgi:hypothetical protein
MTTAIATTEREEIKMIIDYIPDSKLSAIKPLLTILADEDYWKPVIESDLTEEEHAMINAVAGEHTTQWEDVLKELEDKNVAKARQ